MNALMLDRRGFFGQVAAMAAGSSMALPSASPVEAMLIAGLAQMAVLRRAHDDAMAHDDVMKDVYFEGRPARPDSVRQTIRGIPARCKYEIVVEQGRRIGALSRGSLDELRTAPRYATGRCIDDGDEIIVHGGDQLPVSESAKREWHAEDRRAAKKIAKVISASDEWDAQCEAWEEACGYKAAQQAYNDASDAYFAEMERLLALPNETLGVCALKARLLLEHDAQGYSDSFLEFTKQLAGIGQSPTQELAYVPPEPEKVHHA